MKRSGPLKRGAPLKRGKRINPRNEERAAKRRERDFGELADYVRRLPCCVPGCGAVPSDPAHVQSRGAGGHAWTVTDFEIGWDGHSHYTSARRVGNIAPLCRVHHGEQHSDGIATFQARHGLDLAAVARDVGDRFKRGEDPCPLPL